MSLFRSKRKTFVDTHITRVIQDKAIPDSIKTAMMGAIFNGEDVVDSILEASTSAIPVKLERMYNYAKTHSPNGMPTGEVYSNTQGYDEVQAVLDALEGTPVLIEYMRFGGPNTIHMAWMDLIEFHGYSPATNILGSLASAKGKPVYLKDMVVEVPDNLRANYDEQELTVWGDAPSSGYTPEQKIKPSIYVPVFQVFKPPVVIPAAEQLQVRVTYVWEETSGLKTGDMVLPARIADNDLDFFQAKYVVSRQVKYWAYQYGSGTYPTLDAVFTGSPSVVGDFYPNIYFRLNKANIGADTNSAQYKINAKLSKYLGVDYAQMLTNIHENPDAKDVEQAFLTVGIPADTSEAIELEYLYEFFDAWYVAKAAEIRDPIKKYQTSFASFTHSSWSWDSHAITIRDNVFEMNFSNDGIYKTRHVGNIGGVGTVTLSKTPFSSDYGSGQNCRYYRKQITNDFFDEIRVINLTMKYNIYGKYHTVLGDAGDEILLVPLDRGILKEFNTRDSEKLVCRGLHLVFNSRISKKVRWYQQKWFADVIMVVGIVLTIISVGQAGPAVAAIVAALSVSVYVAVLYWVLLQIAIYLVMREALKVFIKLVGVEVAFIAAIVAAAYGVSSGATNGMQTTTQVGLTASSLIQLSSGISQGINTELRSMTEDLMADSARFNTFKKEKLELLEDKLDLLNTDSILSPFVILGEKPDYYFKRTIHSGNIGTLAFDDIHSFVDRSLQLPDFSSSMGGIFYG